MPVMQRIFRWAALVAINLGRLHGLGRRVVAVGAPAGALVAGTSPGAAAAALGLTLTGEVVVARWLHRPGLRAARWVLAGACLARWARGGTVPTRVRLAVVCGVAIGVLSAGANLAVIHNAFPDLSAAVASASGGQSVESYLLISGAWRVFWFTILTVLGALLAEVMGAEPQSRPAAQPAPEL